MANMVDGSVLSVDSVNGSEDGAMSEVQDGAVAEGKVGKRMPRDPEADKKLIEARIARLQAQLEAAKGKLEAKADPVKVAEDADLKRLRGERVALLRFLALNRKGLTTALADVEVKRATIARRESELAELLTQLAAKGWAPPEGDAE